MLEHSDTKPVIGPKLTSQHDLREAGTSRTIEFRTSPTAPLETLDILMAEHSEHLESEQKLVNLSSPRLHVRRVSRVLVVFRYFDGDTERHAVTRLKHDSATDSRSGTTRDATRSPHLLAELLLCERIRIEKGPLFVRFLAVFARRNAVPVSKMSGRQGPSATLHRDRNSALTAT